MSRCTACDCSFPNDEHLPDHLCVNGWTENNDRVGKLIQRINSLERGQRTLLHHIAALLEVTDRMGDTLNLMEALDDEATEFANVRIGAAREVLTQCGVDGATPPAAPAAVTKEQTP